MKSQGLNVRKKLYVFTGFCLLAFWMTVSYSASRGTSNIAYADKIRAGYMSTKDIDILPVMAQNGMNTAIVKFGWLSVPLSPQQRGLLFKWAEACQQTGLYFMPAINLWGAREPHWIQPQHYLYYREKEFNKTPCPLESKLRDRIKSLGASDRITMLGFVEDIRPILFCSDIFVLPSQTEGMPRAMMEAMAMSLPCVATNVGGVSEVLEDGISGLIADFGDMEAFGGSILDLVNNQELRQKMGAAARERVVKNFNMEMITKKHMKFFELIAAGYRDGVGIQKQIDELAECPS